MRRRRSHCARCRRPDTVAGQISKRGLCEGCAIRAIKANEQALLNRQGPEYEKWLRRWREASGGAGRPLTPF